MTKATNTTTTPATDRAALAATAVDVLTEALDAASADATARLSRTLGPDATPATVKLARSVARVMAGEPKPRGGAADRINRVLSAVVDALDAHTPGAQVSATFLVETAAAVMAAHAANEKARRDAVKAERAALKDVWNDRGAPMAERTVAWHAMAELDAADAAAKHTTASATLRAALVAAMGKGFTPFAMLEALADVCGAESVAQAAAAYARATEGGLAVIEADAA